MQLKKIVQKRKPLNKIKRLSRELLLSEFTKTSVL